MGILDWILGKKKDEEMPEKKVAEERVQKKPSIPLTEITGIGEKTEKQLIDAGISDVQDLAEAEIGELSAKVKQSESRLKRWQAQARMLAE